MARLRDLPIGASRYTASGGWQSTCVGPTDRASCRPSPLGRRL